MQIEPYESFFFFFPLKNVQVAHPRADPTLMGISEFLPVATRWIP